jgi:hypothetical protein
MGVESGGAVRKLWAAVWMELPVLVAGRRTAQWDRGRVFDLITSDGRLFYGGSFSAAPQGDESLCEALDAQHRPGG